MYLIRSSTVWREDTGQLFANFAWGGEIVGIGGFLITLQCIITLKQEIEEGGFKYLTLAA